MKYKCTTYPNMRIQNSDGSWLSFVDGNAETEDAKAILTLSLNPAVKEVVEKKANEVVKEIKAKVKEVKEPEIIEVSTIEVPEEVTE